MKYVFSAIYSDDYLRWEPLGKSIIESKNKKTRQSLIDTIQEKIIQENDAALAYHFAADIGHHNYKMQNVIMVAKSAKYAVLFASNIVGADVPALQNMIFQSEDKSKMDYLCQFACFIPGANVKKVESLVMSTQDIKGAHMLIKHGKSSPHKFKKMILASKKPRYLFELARHLKNKKDLETIQQLIIDSKSPTYIRMFAEKIKIADVEKLEEAILESEDVDSIKKFAHYVKKSKMRNFIVMS